MWVDEHPYLSIYLLGSIFVVVLSLVKIILFWPIGWFTKGNTAIKNLKKLLPPDEKTWGEKAILNIGSIAFDVVLSWIAVLLLLWQIATGLFEMLREVISSKPEAIKVLRFPLYNNPNMSREAVWAYSCALEMKAGRNQLNEGDIIDAVNQLHSHYPSFGRTTAVKELDSLNVVSSDLIRSVLSRISSYEELDYEELENKLDDVRKHRDEIINKAASEGKTIPVESLIRHLDALLDENPGDKEIAIEVEARKQELLTKYKDGVPVEVAYQWQKEGEEKFGWDVIHND